MTRRKSKVKVPKAKGEGRGVALRLAKVVLAAAVTAAVGGAVVLGFGMLGQTLRDSPEFQIRRDQLRLADGPDWMTPAMLADLDVTDRLPERFSLLDADVAEQIARAYADCVWVERVDRVRMRDPRVAPRQKLVVELSFRRPSAFVHRPDGFYLVDANGVRLPGVYPEPRLGERAYLVVSGVRSVPPAPGRVWPSESLQAAVRVVETVAPRREAFRLTTVDVSNFAGRHDPTETEIALYTANHTHIKWGKAPTPEAAMLREKTLAEKLAYLDFVYTRLGGRIDGVLSYVDVPNETVRRRTSTVSNRLRS